MHIILISWFVLFSLSYCPLMKYFVEDQFLVMELLEYLFPLALALVCKCFNPLPDDKF